MTIKISKVTAVTIILVFILNEPGFFGTFSGLHSIFNQSRDLIYLALVGVLVMNYKIILQSSLVFWLIASYYLVLLFSTLVNGGPLVSTLNYMIPGLIGCYIVSHLAPEDFLDFLLGASIAYSIITYVNVLSVILMPSGLYNGNPASTAETYFFIGHNNATIKIMISAIIFTGIYDYLMIKRLSLNSYLLIGLAFLSVTITWSNTAMIGAGIFVIYIILIERRTYIISRLIDARFFILTSIVTFLFIVVLRSTTDIISTVVVGVFGKDMTFTGRTILWDYSLVAFAQKPLIGYGYGRTFADIAKITWFTPSSAHNLYVDILLRGGLVQLIIMLMLLIVISVKLAKRRNKLVFFCSFSMLSYYIMWNFEPFLTTGVLGMFLALQTFERITRDDYENWSSIEL